MGHPSALHRPEYPHISPPFLSCPCLQQAVRQKSTFAKRIFNAQRTPIIAHEKKCYQASTLSSQHIITVVTNVIALTRTTVDTTTAPPKRTPVTNAYYIKTYEHVKCYRMSRHHYRGARRGTQLSNCALSNNERHHHNCKKHTHTHSTRD